MATALVPGLEEGGCVPLLPEFMVPMECDATLHPHQAVLPPVLQKSHERQVS